MSGLLVTARDPGAAGHIAAIVRRLRQDANLEVHLVTSGPAHDLLEQSLGEHQVLQLPDGRDHLQQTESSAPLLEATAGILAECRPQAVLTSVSSLGVGIDEAVIALAEVPSFTFQDFWGDANPGLGRLASTYFVLDGMAAALTKKRWDIQNVAVTGPVKYALYERLDPLALRSEARHRAGITARESLIGWFGQSPDIPGHERLFQSLVEVLSTRQPRPRLLLRAHPKFSQARQDNLSLARQAGLQVFDATGIDSTEPWLAACDLVVTPFSLCGQDHAYLCRQSALPMGNLLYLMTEPDTQDFMLKETGLEAMPPTRQGVGHWLTDRSQLARALEDALLPEAIRNYHACVAGLRSPDLSVVTEAIRSAIIR